MPITKNANGTVSVLKSRAGSDGKQVMETVVGRNGSTSTFQRAFDASGKRVHYDPKKASVWERIVGLFR